VCFSIDSIESLENITEKWQPEVKHFVPNVPIILVGNKKDLRNTNGIDPKTLVRYEQGKSVADTIRAYDYKECSAKTKEGVREVFEVATRATFHKKPVKRRCILL
jgi:Ras homolog gene family, member A